MPATHGATSSSAILPAVPSAATPPASVAAPSAAAPGATTAPDVSAAPSAAPSAPSGSVEPPVDPKAASAALAAVSRMPDVKAYCASLERAAQPVHCIVFLAEGPQAPCPAHPAITDECLWQVYVGEDQTTHTVRYTTVYLVPGSWKPVAASDPGCGLMPLGTWRAFRAKQDRSPPGKELACPQVAFF